MNHHYENFDPLQGIVTAQSQMPLDLKKINLRTLTPFQRALLVTDGTVTKFIESYTLEPVEVIRVKQQHMALQEQHPWLEADKGTDIIYREVIIHGKYSHLLYVHAISYFVPERLPEVIRQRLDKQGESIGRILNDSKMETRREILWFGIHRPTHLPNAISDHEQQEFISRTYRIITGDKPIMLINERFPAAGDPLPHHH